MNKFKLLAIAFVLGTTSLVANTYNPEVSKDEIREQIVELVANSKTNIENEKYVDIEFTFNTEGEIVVLKITTRDKEVRSFIREQINGKKLEKPGKVNKRYSMPIVIESL
jgi:flagellar basal body-associated protein FliL